MMGRPLVIKRAVGTGRVVRCECCRLPGDVDSVGAGLVSSHLVQFLTARKMGPRERDVAVLAT
jgi:hypothetical protein